MITICQVCKQAMDVPDMKPGHIAMHEDCSKIAHNVTLYKMKQRNQIVGQRKLARLKKEAYEAKKQAERSKDMSGIQEDTTKTG